MTDTAFTTFAFRSSGGTAYRTLPNRLAEVKNVVDYGADPTGSADSAAYIQAAVDANSGANRGVIYFPLGSYKVTAPITFNYNGNLSICFRGELGTNIFGDVNGYIFDRAFPTAAVTITIASPGVFTESGAHGLSINDPIRLVTQTITGALPTGLTAQTTYYVKTVPSSTTYTVSATPGGAAINTSGSQSGVFTRGPVNTTGGRVFERLNIQNGHATGGCIRMGSTVGGVVRDCLLSGFIDLTTEDGVGVSSRNINVESTTFSSVGGAGSHYIIIGGGGSVQNCTLSGADTAVRAYGSGLNIAGNRSERCNTSFLLGLDSGDNNAGLSGFSLLSTSTEGCWTGYDLAGLCDGFIMSGLGALGHDSGNSGATSGVHGSQYGFRLRADCARNGIIQGLIVGGDFQSVAGFSIADATSRTNLIIREVTAVANNGGGSNWVLPTNAYTAKIINCNTSPVWHFSQLPTGGNVLEGDEFDIDDGTNGLSWGDVCTNTGTHTSHYRVRYNGTNWTVVGK